MILPLLALCFFAQEEQSLDPVIKLLNPASGQETAYIRQYADPLRHPEKSPKQFGEPPSHWEFNWETVAFEKIIPGPSAYARFYVFSQDRKPANDPSLSVARMLERLWEYGYTKLRKDHSQMFGAGVVDVFLCNGGIPGGEQLFDEDSVNGIPDEQGRVRTHIKVNTIYLYDLPTFKDPIEMAREVAHEYGHASLQPVGGYNAPEDWANGYLGERLYLNHIAEGMRAHELEPADAMGASLEDIDKWLDVKVRPLIEEASQRGPDLAALKARDAEGMDHYLGLALYIDTILPESIFSRSQDLIPTSNAEDYPEAIVLAAEEANPYNLKIPSYLRGKHLWIPLSDGRLQGATVEKRSGQWAFIVPTGPTVTISPKHTDD